MLQYFGTIDSAPEIPYNRRMMLPFIDYDAGRPDWESGDCAVRAIAIAAERAYD